MSGGLEGCGAAVPVSSPLNPSTGRPWAQHEALEHDGYVPRTVQGDLLRDAVTHVEGDRNAVYGAPHEDFERTAGQLNALGYRGPGGRLLAGRDWAVIAQCAKQSRLVNSPYHYDSQMDIAGYSGCYWECATSEQEYKDRNP